MDPVDDHAQTNEVLKELYPDVTFTFEDITADGATAPNSKISKYLNNRSVSPIKAKDENVMNDFLTQSFRADQKSTERLSVINNRMNHNNSMEILKKRNSPIFASFQGKFQ